MTELFDCRTKFWKLKKYPYEGTGCPSKNIKMHCKSSSKKYFRIARVCLPTTDNSVDTGDGVSEMTLLYTLYLMNGSDRFWKKYFKKHSQTRLHSSRMHTAQLLTVSPNMHCTGGGACSGGCLVPGGVPGPGGLPLWREGVCSWGVVSQHALRQTPPWTEFFTHTTENITLPQTSFAGGKMIITSSFLPLFSMSTSASQNWSRVSANRFSYPSPSVWQKNHILKG